MRLPWVSIAARGAPAVPLVNISAARCEVSTSTTASGSLDLTRSSNPTVPSDASVWITVSIVGTSDGSTCDQLTALTLSTMTAFAPTTDELGLEFGPGAGRVERDDHGAETDRGQVADHELR